jgi:hypothetical protein
MADQKHLSTRARFLLENFRRLRDQVDLMHKRLDECAKMAAQTLRDDGHRLPEIALTMSRASSAISPSQASRMLAGASSPLPWASKGSKEDR